MRQKLNRKKLLIVECNTKNVKFLFSMKNRYYYSELINFKIPAKNCERTDNYSKLRERIIHFFNDRLEILRIYSN